MHICTKRLQNTTQLRELVNVLCIIQWVSKYMDIDTKIIYS